MTVARHRRRSERLDWGSLATGALCIGGFAAGTLLAASAAVERYGWGIGLLVGWLAGPVTGGAAALLIFLWLSPLLPALPTTAPLRAHRGDGSSGNGRCVSITVVVSVVNNRRLLARSLPLLTAMLADGELLDLIVVDEGSSDGSGDFAAARGAAVLRPVGRLGPGAARNLAVEQARGEVVWFVEPEIAVYPDAPARIRRAFLDEGVVAVFGSYDAAPAEVNFASRYKTLLHHHHHQAAGEEASTFWSGCGAVRRQSFLGLGGFDPVRYRSASIEDVELGYRLCETGKIKLDSQLLGVALRRWSLAEVIRTDVVRRALPWARLMMARGKLPADLNISGPERLRAALAVAGLVSLAASFASLTPLYLPALLFLTAVTGNWRLFQVFKRGGGPGFALLAMAFHQIYYVYSACIVAICWAEARFPWRARAPARLEGHGPSDRSAMA